MICQGTLWDPKTQEIPKVAILRVSVAVPHLRQWRKNCRGRTTHRVRCRFATQKLEERLQERDRKNVLFIAVP